MAEGNEEPVRKRARGNPPSAPTEEKIQMNSLTKLPAVIVDKIAAFLDGCTLLTVEQWLSKAFGNWWSKKNVTTDRWPDLLLYHTQNTQRFDKERFDDLVEAFGHRDLFLRLANRKCMACGVSTPYLFVLRAERACNKCICSIQAIPKTKKDEGCTFTINSVGGCVEWGIEAPRFRVCTKTFATVHYMLGSKQKQRSIVVKDKSVGGFGQEVNVVSEWDAWNKQIERYGSKEAFMAAREKKRATCETKYNKRKAKAQEEKKKEPKMPRTLTMKNEENFAGTNQTRGFMSKPACGYYYVGYLKHINPTWSRRTQTAQHQQPEGEGGKEEEEEKNFC